ncbi:hypothetical protein ACA910_000472 [Epithemia clementina (nom. ined.)]
MTTVTCTSFNTFRKTGFVNSDNSKCVSPKSTRTRTSISTVTFATTITPNGTSPKSVLDCPALITRSISTPSRLTLSAPSLFTSPVQRIQYNDHRETIPVNTKLPPNKKLSWSFSPPSQLSQSSVSFPKPPMRRCKSLPNILFNNQKTKRSKHEAKAIKRKLTKQKHAMDSDETAPNSLPLFWFRPQQSTSSPGSYSSPASATQRKRSSNRSSSVSNLFANTKKSHKHHHYGSPPKGGGSLFMPQHRRTPTPTPPLPLTPRKPQPYLDYRPSQSWSPVQNECSPRATEDKFEDLPRSRLQSAELQGLSFVEDDDNHNTVPPM